jgi:hypothetical protein
MAAQSKAERGSTFAGAGRGGRSLAGAGGACALGGSGCQLADRGSRSRSSASDPIMGSGWDDARSVPAKRSRQAESQK